MGTYLKISNDFNNRAIVHVDTLSPVASTIFLALQMPPDASRNTRLFFRDDSLEGRWAVKFEPYASGDPKKRLTQSLDRLTSLAISDTLLPSFLLAIIWPISNSVNWGRLPILENVILA